MKTFIRTLQKTGLAAILSGSLPLLSGCGGGGTTHQTVSSQTLGQELQDLQQSYDKGIITKKEYEKTKKKLMEKHTD